MATPLDIDSMDVARMTDLEGRQKSALVAGTQTTTPQSAGVMPISGYTQEAVDLNRDNAAALYQSARSLPWRLLVCVVANLPPASAHPGCLVYCADGAGGSPVLAFSTGAHWLRSDTLATIV